MRCPQCGIEMRVVSRNERNGETVLRFSCRNQQCPRFSQEMAEKRIQKSSEPAFILQRKEEKR